jgi:hypothetical protein
MLETIPAYISAIFIATVLLTLYLFVRSTSNKTIVLIVSIVWLVLQGRIAYSGFYDDTETMPPHFSLAVLPALLGIVLLFVTREGRMFIDKINLRSITLLSVVRIPVELVLYWLYIHKAVPQLMTFEGRNFDIVSGITVPVIYFICFTNHTISNRRVLLVWNIISLLLLINIVVNAILSLPFSFQQFAFEQPNVAVLYFPFVWLASFIVMVVLFSHLVSISRLIKNKI